MDTLKHTSKRPNLRFNENEIKLALAMLEKLEDTLEILYYLMEKENENSFVMIMFSAENIDMFQLLKEEKRETDLLYDIDGSKYILICQETKVDGAYRFAQRLMQKLFSNEAKNILCVELEIRSRKYKAREVIFKLMEMYALAQKDGTTDEIHFRSLN